MDTWTGTRSLAQHLRDHPRICANMREYLALLANPVRLKLLCALMDGPHCVSELMALVGERQSTVSQQLKQLHLAGLVGREKQGVRVYYRVGSPTVVETMAFLARLTERIPGGGGAYREEG